MPIKTKHGVIHCPSFFPIIGWPAGRGEYDRLFESLDYFCDKLKHNNFLFNFSSFAFGFTIPKSDFNKIFERFKNKDLRDSLIEFTKINRATAKNLIILLDIGGNRIFNKIIFDGKDPSDIKSYKKYLDAYFRFIEKANVDIYVSFDVGPSYSARDNISKKGVYVWAHLPSEVKNRLNFELLRVSIKEKSKESLIMVPMGGEDIASFTQRLQYLYNHFRDDIDYLAVGGIANKGVAHTEKILSLLRDFLNKKEWPVKVHGLGLGGWRNIPLLVKYGVDTCDNATPWRRACTDAVSKMYVPLFDKNLNFTSYDDAFRYYEIYDKRWDEVTCNCPFCEDMPIKKIQEIYRQSDKNKNGEATHHDDYYKMRVRIFYHNVFQHMALLQKLSEYKEKYGNEFINRFGEEVKSKKIKSYFAKLV